MADTPINSITETSHVLYQYDRAIFALAIIALLVVVFVLPRLKFPRLRVTPMVMILALAFVLRLPYLSESLWYDETFSAAMAKLPLSQLGSAILADVHPPVYYLILWVMAHTIGTAEWMLRLPALVFGLCSVLMTYHLTYRLLNRAHSIALIAAVIVAILPMHIRYSVEARGYMLMVLLVQIALWAQLTRRTVMFAVCVALIPLVHNLGYLYAAGLISGAWMSRSLRVPSILAGIPGAAWLPFLPYQARDVANGFWLQDLTLQGVLRPLATTTVNSYSTAGIFLSIPGWFILVYLGVSVARRWFWRRDMISWALVALGVPMSAAIASWMWHPVYLDRALMPASMLFIPLVAAGIRAQRAAQWIAIVVFPVALVSFATANHRPDNRGWITQCRGEAVYTVSTSTAIIARYYTERDVYIWKGANDLAQSLPEETKLAFGLKISDGVYLPYPLCVLVQSTAYNVTDANTAALRDILWRPYTLTLFASEPLYQLLSYEVSNYE